MKTPMVETKRIPLEPEEHQKLGELIRAAEDSKRVCAKYIDTLGLKYSLYSGSVDCEIGFESGFVVIKEPQRVMRAS